MLFRSAAIAATLSCFLICLTATGQTLEFEWARQIEGTNNDYGQSITTDPNGNVLTTGYFQATAQFDLAGSSASLTSAGQGDIFIHKSSSDGTFLWAKRIGGASSDQGFAVSCDSLGNILLSGQFEGTVDFDPGPDTTELTSNGGYDVFICKLDPDGNFIWAGHMGGSTNDYGHDLAMDNAGNILLAGEFRGTADMDPGTGVDNLISSGQADAFLVKLDANGGLIWARGFGGNRPEHGYGVSADLDGNTYLTGDFIGAADFDPGAGTFELTPVDLYDGFVVKLDSSGSFAWATQFGGNAQDRGYAVATDTAGNVLVTGVFEDTIDVDAGPAVEELISNGSSDVIVLKLEPTGELIWARSFGGGQDDTGESIVTDVDGNIFAAGGYKGILDLDPGPDSVFSPSYGGSDIFLHKLGPDGEFVWASTFGALNEDWANDVHLTSDGRLLATGRFQGMVDFNPTGSGGLLDATGVDPFILSMGIPSVSLEESFSNSTWTISPNPSSGMVTITGESNLRGWKVSLYSIDGRLLSESWIGEEKRVQFSLPDVSGLYLVKMSDGSTSSVRKVIRR